MLLTVSADTDAASLILLLWLLPRRRPILGNQFRFPLSHIVFTFSTFHRGWNYVECMESLTYDNSFDKDNDCWKLTTFCRDVLKTPEMDEFGHGATPEAFVPKNGNVVTIVVALMAGVLASLLVAYAMRGGFKKRDEDFGDVQFSSVRSQDIM